MNPVLLLLLLYRIYIALTVYAALYNMRYSDFEPEFTQERCGKPSCLIGSDISGS